MNPAISELEKNSTLDRIFGILESDLAVVESILSDVTHDSIPLVQEIAGEGCLSGGKRFRPLLLLLAARACGEIRPEHHALAAALEMIHAATLVHDDILDQAATRRHVSSIHARWGNSRAVLFGDYLFSRAFHLASTTGNAEACRIIGLATSRVCEGEMLQGRISGNYAIPLDSYLEIISMKTGALCGCAARLGAMAVGRKGVDAIAWERIGEQFGLALQMIDDILDVEGDTIACGKAPGSDLANRTPTLPVLLALESVDAKSRVVWIERLTVGLAGFEELRDWLASTGALVAAWRIACKAIEKAIDIPQPFRPGAGERFEELGQHLLRRNR